MWTSAHLEQTFTTMISFAAGDDSDDENQMSLTVQQYTSAT